MTITTTTPAVSPLPRLNGLLPNPGPSPTPTRGGPNPFSAPTTDQLPAIVQILDSQD